MGVGSHYEKFPTFHSFFHPLTPGSEIKLGRLASVSKVGAIGCI